MSGHTLLITALTLYLIAVSARVAVPVETAQATSTPPSASTAPGDYVGSKACARCHQDDYEQWERSLHIRMTQPVAEATVLGDFGDGARLAAHDRRFEFGRANGQPFMRIAFGSAKPETFAVDYTLGFKRFQGYLSTLADGRMYVLPAFWHVDSRRWIDWKEITPVPDGAHGLRQIWNTNCFNCHATNISRGFSPTTRRYETTWTEMGVGCEACHGPGRQHVELIDAARTDPSLKPGGTFEIYSSPYGSPRQSFDSCAYCHGNKQNVFVGFAAGDRYEDYALPFLISAPIPETDAQGEFWPDGRPNRFNRPQALMLSGCFKAGAVACTSCHVAHGTPNPFSLKVDITRAQDGDTLCTQCHTGLGSQPSGSGAINSRLAAAVSGSPHTGSSPPPAAIEQHTFHAASSEGSRCISCHMSDVNWRLLTRRRDHTFQAPVPEMTAAFGVPNACTTCHDDRPPEWAARYMDQWWGDGDRRRAALSLAETMYRAGSGDASVLPDLARLAVDRSHGAIVRASAVEFIERLALGTAGTVKADAQSQTSFVGPQAPGPGRPAPGAGPQVPGLQAPVPGPRASGSRPQAPGRSPVKLTHNQVNALIGAAADPEPMVRAQAVNALLATGERDRIVTPLTARLVDPVRIVRARAAEALLVLGITHLPGAAGEALARAQDDFARALMDFPDAAANHAELGWLEASRDRIEAANRALDIAIQLDPSAARPWVVRGVIAAREGNYRAAAEMWRKAKSLQPHYPNIDLMIAELEKRRE